MSFSELFEDMAERRRARKSKEKTPFVFAKLKQQADKWLTPQSTFEVGHVVTANEIFIPLQYPRAGEVYIVLECNIDGFYMADDTSNPYAGIRTDVRILRQDSDGDCIPYLVSSRFLRIATEQEIADAEGKHESNMCPNCGRDHSKDGNADEEVVEDDMPLFYPQVPMRVGRTTVDQFGELLLNAYPEPASSIDEALRMFLNLTMDCIPTHALYKHTQILKQLLAKEFDRVYGLMTPETIHAYNDIIVEARDVSVKDGTHE